MKWFISQPMKSKHSEEEILAERKQIAKEILENYPEDEIIDSYFTDYEPREGNIGMKYLAKSIDLLADADIAYFAKGWADARGCKIEHDVALAYGLTVIEDNN